MFGYVLLSLLTGVGFGRALAPRRAQRSRKPTWQAQIRFVDHGGTVEIVRIANEPRGYMFERTRLRDGGLAGGELIESRLAKGLDNAIDLAADIVSEQASDVDPHVRIDLWRYDTGEYARRAVLASINRNGQGGQIIGQAEVTLGGGRGMQTRNYAAATMRELVRMFVRGQLSLTWEEGLFA